MLWALGATASCGSGSGGEEGEGVVHTQGSPSGHVHPESRSLCFHVRTLSHSVLGDGVQEGGYPATVTKALAYTTFTSKFKVGLPRTNFLTIEYVVPKEGQVVVVFVGTVSVVSDAKCLVFPHFPAYCTPYETVPLIPWPHTPSPCLHPAPSP